MWIRKSPEEIAEIERRQTSRRWRPWWPLFAALLFASAVMLRDMVHGSRNRRGYGEIYPPLSFLEAFPRAVWMLLSVFVLLYSIQIIAAWRSAPARRKTTVFCPRCEATAYGQHATSCACGGTLEPIEYWDFKEQ